MASPTGIPKTFSHPCPTHPADAGSQRPLPRLQESSHFHTQRTRACGAPRGSRAAGGRDSRRDGAMTAFSRVPMRTAPRGQPGPSLEAAGQAGLRIREYRSLYSPTLRWHVGFLLVGEERDREVPGRVWEMSVAGGPGELAVMTCPASQPWAWISSEGSTSRSRSGSMGRHRLPGTNPVIRDRNLFGCVSGPGARFRRHRPRFSTVHRPRLHSEPCLAWD